jgi:hypothetical protein
VRLCSQMRGCMRRMEVLSNLLLPAYRVAQFTTYRDAADCQRRRHCIILPLKLHFRTQCLPKAVLGQLLVLKLLVTFVPPHLYWSRSYLHISTGHVRTSASLLVTFVPPHLYWSRSSLYICTGHVRTSTSLLVTFVPLHLYWSRSYLYISTGHVRTSTSLQVTFVPLHLYWSRLYLYISTGHVCTSTSLLVTFVPLHLKRTSQY